MSATQQTALAFVFPGQGSQSIGMLADFAERSSVRDTFAEASEAIGFDLWELAAIGPEPTLNQTSYTQPLLLAASLAMWRLWQQSGGARPLIMAGHSLGEYSALVAGGALSLVDAVRLVRCRGELMQKAVPNGEGAMAAVLGLDEADVTAACAKVKEGIVAAANLNAPGQVVIAGDKDSVAAAQEHCKAAGAKKFIPLPVSVPAHCALMQDAASSLGARLEDLKLKMPDITLIHNFDVSVSEDVATIKDRLVSQMTAPVRWTETIAALEQRGVTKVVECGPGTILTSLTKRIDKRLEPLSLAKADTFEHALKEVVACG